MFAPPPPVQLSRNEIQSRLTEERRRSRDVGLGIKDAIGMKGAPLHRPASWRSTTSPRGNHPLGKTEKIRVSDRIAERFDPSRIPGITREPLDRLYALSPGFGENPRQAPSPPKRTPWQLDAVWTPSSTSSLPEFPSPSSPNIERRVSDTATIPAKSPLRPEVATIPANLQPLNPTTDRLVGKGGIDSKELNASSPLGQAATAPSVRTVIGNHSATQWYNNGARVVNSTPQAMAFARAEPPRRIGLRERRAAVKGARVEKTIRSRNMYPGASLPRGSFRLVGAMEAKLDSVEQVDVPSQSARSPRNWRQYLEAGLSPISKDSPTVQTTLVLSPTEPHRTMELFKLPSPKSPRFSRRVRRKPKADGLRLSEQKLSPGQLFAIPEYSGVDLNGSLCSGTSTPTTTRIHLRDGSILTVTPPELTPWRKSIYIPGPIRLSTSVVVPRKSALATLEPFQEAIDTLYQEALRISRRRSDIQMQDDVCDFFNAYGFEEVSFAGDVLVSADTAGEDVIAPASDVEVEDSHQRCKSMPDEAHLLAEERAAVERAVRESEAGLWQDPTEDSGVVGTAMQPGLAGRGHRRGDSATLSDGELNGPPSPRQPSGLEAVPGYHEECCTRDPSAAGLGPVGTAEGLDRGRWDR